MTVVLIVIGVIAFLVVDAWIMRHVFASRASRDDYGTFPVPGEMTVTLPASKLKISYQEEYQAGSTGDSIDFGTPEVLKVEVINAVGGDPLPIKGPGIHGMGESLDTGGGWSRSLVGTVEITDPGSYTVTAEPAIPNGVEPKILLGK